jgi:hypothetical protein
MAAHVNTCSRQLLTTDSLAACQAGRHISLFMVDDPKMPQCTTCITDPVAMAVSRESLTF